MVDLPAGGKLTLTTVEEVELWQESRDRYIEDYNFSKQNDLSLLGALLQQQIIVYRAQQEIAGMEPEFDSQNLPTGQWKRMEDADTEGAINRMNKAIGQIQSIEKALGVDKKSREAGGAFSVHDYLQNLKLAAHEYGVHVTERTLKVEEVLNESLWRVRLLLNGDDEDKAYHNLTPDNFITWLDGELEEIVANDKTYANQKGKLWIGKVA